MKSRPSLVLLAIIDVLVGLGVTSMFVKASSTKEAGETWLFTAIGLILVWAFVAGFRSSGFKRACLHPFLIMSPEIVVLPFAIVSCKGFECQGFIPFLMAACLFSLILLPLSLLGCFVGRRLHPVTAV
jgi:hypothetical protein